MDKILRHSVKAIIIKDNKILVESVDYGRGRFCKLPGGGHQWGETMTEAVIRECQEELNITVRPLRLVMARDYIAKNHVQPIDSDNFQQQELMFECAVDDFSTLSNGSEPDSPEQRIQWVEIDKLKDVNFYPVAIIPYLKKLDMIHETLILGDVN